MADDQGKASGMFFRVLVIGFIIGGLVETYYFTPENKCFMTYMYEYPKYKKLEVKTTEKTLENYGLYLYGEGEYFGRVSNLKLEGVPVLFVPGHGGCYKQARSIGSVLLQKSKSRVDDMHFNVFTVDLNEELTAFDGTTLANQEEYLRLAIDHILSLYTGANAPKSVAIIGHSMGGVVSRGLFANELFEGNKINTVITLSSPNLLPVLNMDTHIHHYYQRINAVRLPKHVNLVSIAGGDSRDNQVTTPLTRFPVNMTSSKLSVTLPSVPRANVAADHHCVVWCKQLVLITARYLYDCVDGAARQITGDVTHRTQAARFNFLRHTGAAAFQRRSAIEQATVELNEKYAWKEVTTRCWTPRHEQQDRGVYYAFPVRKLVRDGAPTLVARIETSRDTWILGCSIKGDEKCTKAVDLSNRGILIDDGAGLRVAHLNLKELQDDLSITHVLFPVAKTRHRLMLDVNVLGKKNRNVRVQAPYALSFVWKMGAGTEYDVPKQSCSNKFYQQVSVEQLNSIHQVVSVEANLLADDVVTRAEIDWDEGGVTYGTNKVTVSLRSNSKQTETNQLVRVHFYTKPGKRMTKVTVKFDFFAYLGKTLRLFGASLLTYSVCNIMLMFSHHLRQTNKDKSLNDLYEVHETHGKPFKIQPFMVIVQMIFNNVPAVSNIWKMAMLPPPDYLIMEPTQLAWGFGPIILFFYSFEVIRFVFAVQKAIISVVSFLSRRFLPRSVEVALYENGSTSSVTRAGLHVLVTSVLLMFNHSSLYLLSYCYIMSLVHTARVHSCVIPLEPKPVDAVAGAVEKVNERRTSVPSSSDEDTSSSEDDYVKVNSAKGEEVKSKRSTETVDGVITTPGFEEDENNEKEEEENPADSLGLNPKVVELAETSPSQDEFSSAFVLLQFWLWLVIFTIPSFAAYYRAGYRNSTSTDPMQIVSVLAALLFCLQSVHLNRNSIKASKILHGVSSFLNVLPVVMVLVASVSIYRTPYFILVILAGHTASMYF